MHFEGIKHYQNKAESSNKYKKSNLIYLFFVNF